MATTSDHSTTDREGRFERTSEPLTTASPVEAHPAPTADTASRSGKATASFILGIVGVLAGVAIAIVGLIVGIVATVLGRQAKREVERTGKSNGWMATAGFVLGIVAIGISVVSMIVAAAIIAS